MKTNVQRIRELERELQKLKAITKECTEEVWRREAKTAVNLMHAATVALNSALYLNDESKLKESHAIVRQVMRLLHIRVIGP